MERISEDFTRLIEKITADLADNEGLRLRPEQLEEMATNKSASAHLANTAFENKNYDLACALMQNLLAAGHDDHWIHVLLANSLEQKGELSSALAAMIAALATARGRSIELELRALELLYRLRDVASLREFVKACRPHLIAEAGAAAQLLEWAAISHLLDERILAEALKCSAFALLPRSLQRKLLTCRAYDGHELRRVLAGANISQIIRARSFIPTAAANIPAHDLKLIYCTENDVCEITSIAVVMDPMKDDEVALRIIGEEPQIPFPSAKSWYAIAVEDLLLGLFWGTAEYAGSPNAVESRYYTTLSRFDTQHPLVATLSDHEKFVAETIHTQFNFGYYAAWNFPQQKPSDPYELLIDFLRNWRDRKVSPSPNFSHIDYLATNVDVRHAGVNPFFHFIVAGDKEGRAGKRPGGWRSSAVRDCRSLAEQTVEVRLHRMASPKRIPPGKEVTKTFARLLGKPNHVYITLTHDNPLQNPGGIQGIVAWEMANRPKGSAYLCLYPTDHVPVLVTEPGSSMLVSAVLDGAELIGAELLDLMAGIAEHVSCEKTVIIHQLIGFKIPVVQKALDLLAPTAVKFWLHDYLAICANWLLLRNDVEHCQAVPPTATACQICVYHEDRLPHLTAIRDLLTDQRISFIAPSPTAADIVARGANIEPARITVRPHVKFSRTRYEDVSKNSDRPVRIAFMGQPVLPKGWGEYLELVNQVSALVPAEFYIFGARGCDVPLIKHVKVIGGLGKSSAMVEALMKHEIDFSLVGSIYRETFCFTAYEALAAGCTVLVSDQAGNPYESVSQFESATGYSSLDEAVALIESFASGLRTRKKLASGKLALSGFTFG